MTKRYSALLVLLLILTDATLFAAGSEETIDAASIVGELVFMEGEVLLNDSPAAIGDLVHPGDRIETGQASQVEIVLGEHNILHFREGTNMVIEDNWGGIALERGAVAGVLNGLAKLGFGNKKQFGVTTDTTIMAVRGTSFFIRITEDEGYFCTCNGKLHLESTDGQLSENTEAYHHAAILYRQAADGSIEASSPPTLLYHDDDTLNSIAVKVNTQVDWRD